MDEKCSICSKIKLDIEKRRRNTYYRDDESNHITSCYDCFVEDERYWRERHQEYMDAVMMRAEGETN